MGPISLELEKRAPLRTSALNALLRSIAAKLPNRTALRGKQCQLLIKLTDYGLCYMIQSMVKVMLYRNYAYKQCTMVFQFVFYNIQMVVCSNHKYRMPCIETPSCTVFQSL